MESINQRIIKLFESLNIKRSEFADRIGVSQAYISKLFKDESEKKPSERLLKIICSEFNVREDWIRHGTGEMFAENNISLDEYAAQNGMTDLERDLFLSFMSLDRDVRLQVLDHLRKVFNKHEQAAAIEDEIKQKTRHYEQELRSEKSTQTSSVLPTGKEKKMGSDGATTRKRVAASQWEDVDL